MGVIKITAEELMLGESSSDAASDRGYSPDSYNINLFKTRGTFSLNAAPTQIGSAVLTGNIVARAYDNQLSGNDAYFLDDEGAFYYLSGTTLTKAQTTGADTFQLGTSDMIQFRAGNTFATGATRVIMLTGSNLATIDAAWWTGLTTSYRHPLEIVEDKLLIGDVNLIHAWDGTTSTNAYVTLPTGVNITSLRKHPDGRQLIAFCGKTANFSHTKPNGGLAYLVDLVTKTWTREIELEAQVEGSRSVGGIVYVSYGDNIGYFNGNGITFLKKLATSATTYSHSMSNWDDVFLVRDGRKVLAYGNLGKGKVWSSCIRNTGTTNNIDVIVYQTASKILIAYQTDTLYQFDLSTAGSNGAFFSNRYYLGKAKIRKIIVVHTVSSPSVATNDLYYVYQRDEIGNENLIEAVNGTNASASAINEFSCDMEASVFQLLLTVNDYTSSFRAIFVFYDSI